MSQSIPISSISSHSPPASIAGETLLPYEIRLSQSREWALSEGSLFFEGRGRVHESFRRITRRLDELGIAYAVAGGMALFLHGYRRFTEDVDILVTREGLERIHQELDGRGYVRPFVKSKNLRDAESRVKIEFLVTGEYPGDGKPKDIQFPDPTDAADLLDGVRVLNIPQVISLKIASGITGEGRTRDIADVEELIKLLNLPASLADSLHPFSRDRYIEIWRKLHSGKKRFLRLWRSEALTSDARTIEDIIEALGAAAEELKAMRDDGVMLDADAGITDDYAHLITMDPVTAKKYGMEDESEYWGLNEHDEDSAEE